jgi:hypothetical protein
LAIACLVSSRALAEEGVALDESGHWRHEMPLEGIQEAEARIFLEQALDQNRLPANLARKVKELLARRLSDTSIAQPNVLVPNWRSTTSAGSSVRANCTSWPPRQRPR